MRIVTDRGKKFKNVVSNVTDTEDTVVRHVVGKR